MNNIIIILILFLAIKGEHWWPEVDGYTIYDNDNGYAGSPPYKMDDFYLCSERKYKVHYLNDDNDTWSEEFSACEPVGIDRVIDMISINGELKYEVYTNKGWLGSRYDDYYGFKYAGNLSLPIMAITIEGGERYRSSDDFLRNLCTNEKILSKRIIYNLFDYNCTFDFNYVNETTIINNENISVSVILLKQRNLNFKGSIKIKIENTKIKKANYNWLLSKDYYSFVNTEIGFDINYIKEYFENKTLKNGLDNGDIIFNFKWPENLIEIDVCSKIAHNHYGYRGGFRIKIYLSDDNLAIFSTIKKIFKCLVRYSGKRIPNYINELLSNLDSFQKVEELIQFLGIYSVSLEETILFTILSKLLFFEKEK